MRVQLNNYMRASMGKDRLSHLALLYIPYTTPVDLDTVVGCYVRPQPRRLQREKSSAITATLISSDTVNTKGTF